jgi:hypothetical protein
MPIQHRALHPGLFRAVLIPVAFAVACSGQPVVSTPTGPMALALVDSVHHIDALAREPMVVAHPGGTLFITGYWDSPPPVWKSTNGGSTWTRVPVGTAGEGAAGNSDSDLAVGADGTIYLITLVFDRAAYKGASVHVAVSRDVGEAWTWTRLSATTGDDRPWIEVAPDGTAHAIWNDGAGVSHAVSTDTGRTWIEGERINDKGGSSHLAVGPAGELAVRIGPMSASGNQYDAGVDLIAVSSDGGKTWDRRAPPVTLNFPLFWDTTVTPRRPVEAVQPRWVEPLAWDATGALYSFWANDRHLWLARSRDRGATWTTWQIAEADSTPYFPYLVARGDGELAASWFSGHGDSLRANIARITVPADDASPLVAVAPSFQPESFAIPGFGPPGGDTAGEYLPIVFLPDGSLGLVTPIQNLAAERVGFSWRRYASQP